MQQVGIKYYVFRSMSTVFHLFVCRSKTDVLLLQAEGCTCGTLLLTVSDVACLYIIIWTVLIYHVMGWGVSFVCILIVDEPLVSPGAAAARNWIPGL